MCLSYAMIMRYVSCYWLMVWHEGPREINRLDITMQPSRQHIFYQIIDSCLYFPESHVIFIAKFAEENKTKSVSDVNKVGGQKFKKKSKWF